MRSLILVLLALLILGGAAYLLTAADSHSLARGVDGPDAIASGPSRAPAEVEPVPERPMEQPPALPVDPPKKKAPKKTVEPEPAKPAPKPPAPVPASAASFQQKYTGLSLQELNRASRQLYSDHRSSIQALMEERYANAFYEAYPYEYDLDGERLDPDEVIPAPPAGEYRIRQIFEDPAVDEWRVVELPPAEHPDLYETYREWQWVLEEVKQREKERKD